VNPDQRSKQILLYTEISANIGNKSTVMDVQKVTRYLHK